MRHLYTDLLETRLSREFKYKLVSFKSPCFKKFIHYFLMCSICAYIGACVCVRACMHVCVVRVRAGDWQRLILNVFLN